MQVKNLSKEQIDKICDAIGEAFYEHDYGDTEKGLVKYAADKKMMAQYIKAIFVAGLKCGTLYSTSERGEGYIVLSGSKWERMKIGPALTMVKDMVKALGLRRSVQVIKEINSAGLALDDKLKKEKKDYIKVDMLVVLKEYQGQGYMRKLMEIAYAKADEHGVPCILDTDAKNKLDKYCHLGMKHVATRKVTEDFIIYDLMREG